VTEPYSLRLAIALVVTVAACTAYGEEPGSRQPNQIPKEKQTKLALYLTAKEAYDKWKAEPDRVKILAVRTPEELVFVGHPDMAWNVPFGFVTYEKEGDKSKCSIKPNPDFVSQVKEWAKPTDTILCMCRSGGRGALAVNLLAEVGFKNVNVIDGFEGDMVDDPDSVFHGKRMKNGWKISGLPWNYDVDPEKMLLLKR
jgi:rhodanese-related sulfurtransferase